MTAFIVRPAALHDLERVGRLAGHLVRMHHDADPSRFMLVDDVEAGYVRWFSRELGRSQAVILVAVAAPDDDILGYAYGAVEGRDWNMLLDAHGALHDVYVEPACRRSGVGKALVETMVASLHKQGVPRILLSTMVMNESAQRLFRACGFRPTMLEMTR